MEPPGETALGRNDVVAAIRGILPLLETLRASIRVVGTASSLLRGIDLPAGDVDISARQRAIVDELSLGTATAGGRCLANPAWLETNPGFGQYFAAFDVSGIRVEFSTVEATTGDPIPIGECIGEAPWDHFDVLLVEGYQVPVVASELRLLSEIIRCRPDRWKPIAARLARDGYDHDLFTAALQRLPPELQEAMRDAVRKAPP